MPPLRTIITTVCLSYGLQYAGHYALSGCNRP